MKLSSQPRFLHAYPSRTLPQLKTLSPPFADNQRHHRPKQRDARRAKAHGEAPPPFRYVGSGALSRGLSLSCPHHLRQPGYLPPLQRSMGFAPPPRGGFAFLASPERHSA